MEMVVLLNIQTKKEINLKLNATTELMYKSWTGFFTPDSLLVAFSH